MNRIITYITIVAFVLSTNTTFSQDIWKYYSPENTQANFTVKSPGKLSYQVDTVYRDYDMIISEVFYYKGDDNTYMITHLKYPDNFIQKDSVDIVVDDILDHSIHSLQESLLGRIIYKENLNDSRYIGKRYRIRYDADKKTIKARMFFYNNALYNIQVSSPVEDSLEKDIDVFLNSFKLDDI